jgi:hypothetical protein
MFNSSNVLDASSNIILMAFFVLEIKFDIEPVASISISVLVVLISFDRPMFNDFKYSNIYGSLIAL